MKKLKISRKSFETIFTFYLEATRIDTVYNPETSIIYPTPPEPPTPPPTPPTPTSKPNPFPPLLPRPNGLPPHNIPPMIEVPYEQVWYREVFHVYQKDYAVLTNPGGIASYGEVGLDGYNGWKENLISEGNTVITANHPGDFERTIVSLGMIPYYTEYSEKIEFTTLYQYSKFAPVVAFDNAVTKQFVDFSEDGISQEIIDTEIGVSYLGITRVISANMYFDPNVPAILVPN